MGRRVTWLVKALRPTYLVRLDVGDEVDEPCNLRHVVTSVDATALTFTPRPSD